MNNFKVLLKSVSASIYGAIIYCFLWAVISALLTPILFPDVEAIPFLSALISAFVIYFPIYSFLSALSYCIVWKHFRSLSFKNGYIHATAFALAFSVLTIFTAILEVASSMASTVILLIVFTIGICFSTVSYSKNVASSM